MDDYARILCPNGGIRSLQKWSANTSSIVFQVMDHLGR